MTTGISARSIEYFVLLHIPIIEPRSVQVIDTIDDTRDGFRVTAQYGLEEPFEFFVARADILLTGPDFAAKYKAVVDGKLFEIWGRFKNENSTDRARYSDPSEPKAPQSNAPPARSTLALPAAHHKRK